MTDRKSRTIYYGATQNGNQIVGGWLPFVVDLSPIYGVMRVHGTLYTDYMIATCESREQAIEAAKKAAMRGHFEEGDTLQQADGCHRCWNDIDTANPKRVDGVVRCALCDRVLPEAC